MSEVIPDYFICWIKYPKDDDHKAKMITGFSNQDGAIKCYVDLLRLIDQRTVICCLPVDDRLLERSVFTVKNWTKDGKYKK